MRRALTIAVLLLASGRAEAGRTFYGWSYGTELDPERGVELETWMIEEEGTDVGATGRETRVWWGPTVGITDHLELAIPTEMAWDANATRATTSLDRFGVELRFRPDSPDPLEAGCWTTMWRVAVKHMIPERAARAEADAVVAFEHDGVHAEADVGAVGIRNADGTVSAELHPGVGASVRVAPDLRVGAEAYAELGLRGEYTSQSWAIVGPSLAWTHGRFWLAGNLGVGVYQIHVAARVNFAVAF